MIKFIITDIEEWCFCVRWGKSIYKHGKDVRGIGMTPLEMILWERRERGIIAECEALDQAIPNGLIARGM